MEIHRLKPMKKGYSKQLFEKLYKETKPLRKSLARQIDSRRYGVTNDIIESWFDDKFIFVFNKHFDNKDENVLKGFIINSLKMFKYRILRKAYNKEGEYYSSLVQLEGENELINIIPDESLKTHEDVFYNLAIEYMKQKISDDAYLLLQIQLNPPPFILDKIKNYNSHIPNKLVSTYLGIELGSEDRNNKYIRKLKKEISKATKSAKEYFSEEKTMALV